MQWLCVGQARGWNVITLNVCMCGQCSRNMHVHTHVHAPGGGPRDLVAGCPPVPCAGGLCIVCWIV